MSKLSLAKTRLNYLMVLSLDFQGLRDWDCTLLFGKKCELIYDQPKILRNTCEHVPEKTNNSGFRPGPSQTSLYSHRR